MGELEDCKTALEAIEAERDGYCAGHRIEQELRKGVEERAERAEAELTDARAQHLLLTGQALDATTRAEQAEAQRDTLAGLLKDSLEDERQKGYRITPDREAIRQALTALESQPHDR